MHDPNSSQQLAAWLTSLRPGESQTLDALTVAPLYADSAPPPFSYLALSDAHASGLVGVTEKPQASVPTLLVINRAPLPILILDGEEVVGGLQNRVVNTTLLVPAASTLELDVSCVEHGRWHPSATDAFSPGEAVYPTLRRQKAEHVTASLSASGVPRADQAAVWNEISTRHARHATPSSTQAVHDAYVERAEALRRAEESLRYPADGPVGVVGVVAGQPVCADIFDRPSTLATYWPRLVRSYTLEAEDVASAGSTTGAFNAASLTRFLASAAAASVCTFASRGLGDDLRLANSRLVGAALVHEGSAVHTAIFHTDRRAGNPVSRPSARARRRPRVQAPKPQAESPSQTPHRHEQA